MNNFITTIKVKWILRKEISRAKRELIEELFRKLPKLGELDGLGSIVNDETNVTIYDNLTKTTYQELIREGRIDPNEAIWIETNGRSVIEALNDPETKIRLKDKKQLEREKYGQS